MQSYCDNSMGLGAPTRIDNVYFDTAICGCERTIFSCSTMNPPISTSWWRYPVSIDKNTTICPTGYAPNSSLNACVLLTATPVCPQDTPQYTYNPASGMCERTMVCPAPDAIDPATGKCEPPETYTLTLKPDRTTTEPSTNLGLTVTVENQDHQPPKKPVPVKISLKVDSTSGGHDHGDSTRPRGGINNKDCVSDDTCVTLSVGGTGSSGSTSITFNSRDASGEHTITATCDKCSNGPQDAKVKVMVEGLVPIPASQSYALTDSGGNVIGGEQSKPHHDNHYLTAGAIAKLEKMAEIYKSVINPGQRLYLNDASLKWGGLFDVGSISWKKPHTTHRRGVEIDIRAAAAANGAPVKEGAIPFNLFHQVWYEAGMKGIKAELHCLENKQLVIGMSCYWLPDARHFHVNLR